MDKPIWAPKQRIRVLIADADKMNSQLIASALKRCRNFFDVVAVASSSGEAIKELEIHKPDIAVLSAELQDGPQSGFKVLQQLRSVYQDTAGIMLLHATKRDSVVGAFRAGARGVISRDKSFKSLAKCIRCVHRGRIWASNEELEFILDALAQLKLPQLTTTNATASLTPRERDVVRLVAEGLKNREIAQELHVTEHTVSNYLYRIFDKLGVSSRVELILYATNQTEPDQLASLP